MGYNKCHLPSIDHMEKEIETYGLESFVKRYVKYDFIIGETEPMNFLEMKIKEYETITKVSDIYI